MRILFAIPHFYNTRGRAGKAADSIHGSDSSGADRRAFLFFRALSTLHQTFGPGQAHIAALDTACNSTIAAEIVVIVCTTGDYHLLDRVPRHLFRHYATDAEPMLLGYECHVVLAEHVGRFDYYCFMEDDLLLNDPLFFRKQRWFNSIAGNGAALQPHRFETAAKPPFYKLYIDGPIRDPNIAPRFQNTRERPRIGARALDVEVVFERVDNPHSGCFFLTNDQMARWARAPYFLDRAADFWGPLESAATLGLMRTFNVYKPARDNAGFLEIQHLDNRYLGRLLRLRNAAL